MDITQSHAWAAAARLFALLQPSSASVELVFSMLPATVTAQQEKMLEDQEELRIRTRYSMKKHVVDPERSYFSETGASFRLLLRP